MASNLYIGSTVLIRCTFRGWSDVSEQGDLEDPLSVVVRVVDSNGDIVLTATPVREEFAVYSYQWTPAEAGEYTVEFVGTFSEGATPSSSVVPTEFNVTETDDSPTSGMSETLGSDEFIVYMATLDPMFADYEELITYFPDAEAYEIAELIHNYSVEAMELAGVVDATLVTPLMREFVIAAVACALSRVHDFDGGDETEVTLGDLSISKRPGQNSNSTVLSRFTASSWCELAAVLRDEILRGTGKAGLKAIVKGSNVICPMPNRKLQPQEWRSWGFDRS